VADHLGAIVPLVDTSDFVSTEISLEEIVKHPDRARRLSPDVATVLLAQCVSIQASLVAAVLSPRVINTNEISQHDGRGQDDRLMNVQEAASKLGVSVDWIYRNAAKLPFTVRLGPRRLRFSTKGINKFIQSRQGRA